MPDSFDARMQGQTPESIKPKSSKGWMIAAIIAIIGVVALGVTEFLAYQEIAKKDDEIANLKKQSENKSETETETEETLNLKGFDLDGPGLTKLLEVGDDTANYPKYINELKTTKISKDGKYLYSEIGGHTEHGGGWTTLVYRVLPDGEWKTSGVSRNSVSNCKDFSKEALEVLIDMGNGESEGCMADGWKDGDELTKLQDYYDKTYKESE